MKCIEISLFGGINGWIKVLPFWSLYVYIVLQFQVDFIWINRDQKAFEWFLTILNQLEVEQSAHHGALEKCIQMHLYMTAAQKKTDMKGIGLQV